LLKLREILLCPSILGDFIKPKKSKQREQEDLFRSRLDQILDRQHPLYQLAHQIDWLVFDKRFGSLYAEKGRPGKATRLLVGLHYLKHAFDESDESVVARFLENPYWQYFCGFEYFIHRLPLDPSSVTCLTASILNSSV
jgi:IS5 family transposase